MCKNTTPARDGTNFFLKTTLYSLGHSMFVLVVISAVVYFIVLNAILHPPLPLLLLCSGSGRCNVSFGGLTSVRAFSAQEPFLADIQDVGNERRWSGGSHGVVCVVRDLGLWPCSSWLVCCSSCVAIVLGLGGVHGVSATQEAEWQNTFII